METKRLEVTAEGKKVYDIVIENNRKAGCILLS